MKLSTILFDLDDTLYPPASGIWLMIRDKIEEYMVSRLSFSSEEAKNTRRRFFQLYGTTLRGLQMEYQIDPVPYLRFVHDLPIKEIIKPNPQLKTILATIPYRKVIFTNSDRWHTERVLDALEILDYFEEVVDILDTQPFCKPMENAFEKAFVKLGISDPSTCMLVDDSSRNISTAQSMGMNTVWVSEQESETLDGHFHIAQIEEFGKIFQN
jgi:putative hydrolase of the HAD superfamily